MAIVHKASLSPTKVELIASWLPTRPWYVGDAGVVFTQVGAFRFDDPAGEVGLQVLLVRAEGIGRLYQVPMTYRSAPLDGASNGLIGEMSHSVLGPRYVYDGCHDPVFVGELVRAVLTGGAEVDELIEIEGKVVTVPKSMHVRGSGEATATIPMLGPLDVRAAGEHDTLAIVRSGRVEVTVPRVLDGRVDSTGPATLTGSWGDDDSACLATVRVVDEG